MKYSLLLSLLSLIAWKYDCLFPAGLFGLLAGFLFSLLFRRKIQILAIGYISASILTVILFPIEFSFAAIARIGIAWAVQELPQVPTDPWDVPLHAIATDKDWIIP